MATLLTTPKRIVEEKDGVVVYPSAWRRKNRCSKNRHRKRNHPLPAYCRRRLHLPRKRHMAPTCPRQKLRRSHRRPRPHTHQPSSQAWQQGYNFNL